jgi:hypothetical protein
MTLEEKIQRYAEKGELVHLSLAFREGWHARIALASAAGGYSSGEDKDPIAALDKAFAATPVKVRAPKHREEVTAAVTE